MKALKALKNTKGYVSLEAVVVTGVICTLGVYILTNMFQTGKIVNDSSIALETKVMDITK